MRNVEKIFSLKLIKKDTYPRRYQGTQLERMKSFNSKSNDNSEDMETEDALTRSEEAKLAEEAYITNLKLIKKQKAKFLRLQKILSRNVILIPLCALFSVLSASTIFSSTLTDYYELISYDIDSLRTQIDIENNRTIADFNAKINLNLTLDDFLSFQNIKKLMKNFLDLDEHAPGGTVKGNDNPIQYVNNLKDNRPPRVNSQAIKEQLASTFIYELSNAINDYHIVKRHSFHLNENSSNVKLNILYETYSGIWKFCNYLSNESRIELKVDKCTMYKRANIELDDFSKYYNSDSSDPGRDLVRMHNAAACCTIVSYFLLVFSWITGMMAAITKRVPVSLASCVLNLLIAVFLLLMLAIFHRKIFTEEKRSDCYDLKIFFNIVCSHRIVRFGYSLGLTWLAFLATFINGLCWFHITKMQKLLFAHGYYYS